MAVYRSDVVKQARAWLGRKESDGSHKLIIDVYNSISPLPRGYKLSYRDPWCAGFVSAVAKKAGALKIIPAECSCNRMIKLFKDLGEWVENDAYVPKAGDIMFYDWDDSGSGDNKNEADHVGIVESVSGNTITVIEGNYSDAVKRRTMKVNGRYIRGYGVPKYDAEPVITCTVTLNEIKRGAKGAQVKSMQTLLIAKGYSCGKYGADGDWGADTDSAVEKFQKAMGLAADKECGHDTWTALLTK